MENQDTSEAVVVFRCDNYLEADLIVRVLRDEGISSAVRNASPSAGITGTVTLGDGVDSAVWAAFEVITPAGSATRARQVIADWQQATPRMPREETEEEG